MEGPYQVWLRAQPSDNVTDWIGPFEFTLAAAPPDIPTIRNVENFTIDTPTFNWTLDTPDATYASWFHLHVLPVDENDVVNGEPVIDSWHQAQ